MTLLLCEQGALQRPLLCLSYYFKQNKTESCDRLRAVRDTGDWEGWLKFSLRGVAVVAQEAAVTARKVEDLWEQDRWATLTGVSGLAISMSPATLNASSPTKPISAVWKSASSSSGTAPPSPTLSSPTSWSFASTARVIRSVNRSRSPAAVVSASTPPSTSMVSPLSHCSEAALVDDDCEIAVGGLHTHLETLKRKPKCDVEDIEVASGLRRPFVSNCCFVDSDIDYAELQLGDCLQIVHQERAGQCRLRRQTHERAIRFVSPNHGASVYLCL